MIDRKKTIIPLVVMSILTIALAPAAMAAVTSLQTDKPSYFRGELITITGTATPNQLVGIQVNDPLGTAQFIVSVNSGISGVFTREFRTTAVSVLGEWTVTATEGGSSMTTTFNLVSDTTPPVLGLSLSPSQTSYQPGDTITITVTSNEALQNAPAVNVGQTGANPLTVPMTSSGTNTWIGQYTIVPGRFGLATVSASGSDISNNQNTVTRTFNVAPTGALSVEIETPTIYYPDDNVRIAILALLEGNLVEASIGTSHIVTPSGSIVDIGPEADVHAGLMYIDYDLPSNAACGIYTVHVQANYLGLQGGDIATFEVNCNLPSNEDISGLSADINQMRSTVNSLSTSINNGLNDVKSTLGSQISDVETSLSNSILAAQGEIQSSISSSTNSINSAISSAQSSVISSITSSQNTITSAISSSETAILNAIAGVESSVSSAVSNIVAPLSGDMDNVVSTVNQMDENLNSIEEGLASVSTWILIVGIIAAITLVLELVALIRKLS